MSQYRNSLTGYNSAIKHFEEIYLNDIYNNNLDHREHRGYIVNLEIYTHLKNKIKAINSLQNQNKSASYNFKILKNIEFKTSTYLINKLFNENKYIIINTPLWDLFGDKSQNDSYILYSIDKDIITLNLNDNTLKFSCVYHNNIIEISYFTNKNNNNYSNLKSNFENIENIYRSIVEYSNIENEFKNNLRKPISNNSEIGYLIEEKWINNWMDKTNYIKLKEQFKDFKDAKKIKDILIYCEENYGKIKNKLGKIEIKKFRNQNELLSFLEILFIHF